MRPSPFRRSRLAPVALAAVALVSGSAFAQSVAPAPFSAPQRQAIEGIIGEYLLANPDVLRRALAEVMRQDEAAQVAAQQKAVREARETLAGTASATVLGNPNGDVTLVEFFDFNCSFCKKAAQDLRTLAKSDPKLRIVVRDLTIIGGPASEEASRIALAARAQLTGDKLFDYHSRVMDSRGRVNGERALAVAREMGLDAARLQRDAASPEIAAALAENMDLARKLGVNGTPAFVVGDEVISGAVGVEPLRTALASLRKCGQASC